MGLLSLVVRGQRQQVDAQLFQRQGILGMLQRHIRRVVQREWGGIIEYHLNMSGGLETFSSMVHDSHENKG